MEFEELNKQFSVVYNQETINDFFIELKGEGFHFSIWQKESVGENRKVIKVRFCSLDISGNLISLKHKANFSSTFNLNKPLYIFCYNRPVIFKSEIKCIKGNNIHIYLPEVLRIRERRKEARIRFSLKAIVTIVKVGQEHYENNAYSYSLFDVSANGLAFALPDYRSREISVGDRIKVEMVASNYVPFAPEGEVIYIQDNGSKYSKRVGVKFEQKINFKFFNKLKRINANRFEYQMTRERRDNLRISYKETPTLIKLIKMKSFDITHNFNLHDFSRGGLSFEISRDRINLFNLGEFINILEIGRRQVPSNLKGEIVHITEIDKKRDNLRKKFKVGVRFTE